MKRAPVNTQRRNLLSTAGSIGAAGVAAGVLGPAATAQVAPTAAVPKPASPGGYRETAHIRSYYRLARY